MYCIGNWNVAKRALASRASIIFGASLVSADFQMYETC